MPRLRTSTDALAYLQKTTRPCADPFATHRPGNDDVQSQLSVSTDHWHVACSSRVHIALTTTHRGFAPQDRTMIQLPWWHGISRLRVSLRQFAWLLMAVGVAVCLLSGCGRRHATPFAEQPSPDLAVTTLDAQDITTIASVIQIQATITRGCELSLARPLPENLRLLVQDITDQQQSRGRDLAALVQLKNAPASEGLARHQEAWLAGLARSLTAAPDAAPDVTTDRVTAAVVSFHRTTQTEIFRWLRHAVDESRDPDVQAYAKRQIRGVANIRARLDDHEF